MWRPGLEIVAVITVVGWLAAPPRGAAEDEGNYRRLPNLDVAGAPGREFSTGHAEVPPSLGSPNALTANGTRVAALGSEPLERKPRTTRRPALLIGLYVSYGLLQALDAQSTIRALHTGATHEANPLLSPFAAHPAALATFKLGLTGGTIYGVDRLYKSHRRLAIITLAAINSGYACIVLRNYRRFPPR